LTEINPFDGRSWMRLGYALHNMKEYKQAAVAYEKANENEYALSLTRYNLACAMAMQGDTEAAFEWLERALEAGWSNVKQLREDTDLESLRNDPRFAEAIKVADRNDRPCEYDDRYRQFDFWIGSWNVYNPQGSKVGENRITRELKGCMLHEHWQSVLGNTGQSINYFDPAKKKWIQQWVDAGGGVINYEGEFSDGAMRFQGVNISMDGTSELSRMTFTPNPDGIVWQLIEQSKDNGKTWYVWFDGKYVPMDDTEGK